MAIETTASDPFDQADSIASILAYIHERFGAEGVRQLLGMVDLDRDSMERAAAELELVGLPKVAEIISVAAQDALPAEIMFNPREESNRANYTCWQRAHQNRQAGKRTGSNARDGKEDFRFGR